MKVSLVKSVIETIIDEPIYSVVLATDKIEQSTLGGTPPPHETDLQDSLDTLDSSSGVKS